MADIVDRLRALRPVTQFDRAGQIIKFDATPSDLEREAAVEIERLRSDLALLGPVTTPTHGLLCASCIQDVSPNWTYCPYCGAQERNSATGERLLQQVRNRK